ncbi:hypothetical protein WICMUC_003949 [Wickerhamomyces mucosus]|uniref:Secreted protein n=1 Tax=Wickerhamomyces mucosus TaxID=1378264 RepID=A0A9P8TC96_9ASCO|nr:hypothetical protein WICMUC_003949 [Wickerhamomyces mucosus]
MKLSFTLSWLIGLASAQSWSYTTSCPSAPDPVTSVTVVTSTNTFGSTGIFTQTFITTYISDCSPTTSTIDGYTTYPI